MPAVVSRSALSPHVADLSADLSADLIADPLGEKSQPAHHSSTG
jgi:hypothetical protein